MNQKGTVWHFSDFLQRKKASQRQVGISHAEREYIICPNCIPSLKGSLLLKFSLGGHNYSTTPSSMDWNTIFLFCTVIYFCLNTVYKDTFCAQIHERSCSFTLHSLPYLAAHQHFCSSLCCPSVQLDMLCLNPLSGSWLTISQFLDAILHLARLVSCYFSSLKPNVANSE